MDNGESRNWTTIFLIGSLVSCIYVDMYVFRVRELESGRKFGQKGKIGSLSQCSTLEFNLNIEKRKKMKKFGGVGEMTHVIF